MLPVATLVIVIVPYIFRMMRAAMIEALESDYVEMAKLKGAPRWRVMLVHALPNSIAPTIQVIGLNLLYLAGGIVVVEYVFAYPGTRGGARRRRLGPRHPDDPVHHARAGRLLRVHEHPDRRRGAAGITATTAPAVMKARDDSRHRWIGDGAEGRPSVIACGGTSGWPSSARRPAAGAA